MAPLDDMYEEWPAEKGMRLLSADRMVRAVIADDGEVKDGTGQTLAFIEANGEVGDSAMNYAGKAMQGASQVVDHQEMLLGEFDMGRGYIKDAQGSVVAEIFKEGSVKNNHGQHVGTVENFTYTNLATLAAYFLIVDTGFVGTER